MDERTLIALRGSIAKWEAIVARAGKDDGITNCPLCRTFYSNDCRGCPVRQKTKQINCRHTPYDAWSAATGGVNGRVTDDRSLAVAQAELDFLRSLLPKGDSTMSSAKRTA